MKIEGPSKPIALDAVRAVATKRVEPQTRTRREDDHVRISGEARTLIEARGPERPDRAKIESLKASIKAGTFRIDSERIADAMIAEEGG